MFMYSSTEKKFTTCFSSAHTCIFTTASPKVGEAIFLIIHNWTAEKIVLICTSWTTGNTHQFSGLLITYICLLLWNPCSGLFPSWYWGSRFILVDRFLPSNYEVFIVTCITNSFFQFIPCHLNLPNIYYKDGLNFFLVKRIYFQFMISGFVTL